MVEKIRDVRVWCRFRPLEKTACVSNKRLHNENLCVPAVNEGRQGCHKDLRVADFKSHVMPFADIKTLPYVQRLFCRGITALVQILPVYQR